MIRLINKDNARIDMIVKVRDLNGCVFKANMIIAEIGSEKLNNWSWEGNYFELVSMPERRLLTWEYVKDKIVECPLQIWDGDGINFLQFANHRELFVQFVQRWEDTEYFIDPPHPEIPEVPEPWLVKIPEPYKNIGKVSVRNGFISFSLTEFFNLDRKLDFDLYIKEGEK